MTSRISGVIVCCLWFFRLHGKVHVVGVVPGDAVIFSKTFEVLEVAKSINAEEEEKQHSENEKEEKNDPNNCSG